MTVLRIMKVLGMMTILSNMGSFRVYDRFLEDYDGYNSAIFNATLYSFTYLNISAQYKVVVFSTSS